MDGLQLFQLALRHRFCSSENAAASAAAAKRTAATRNSARIWVVFSREEVPKKKIGERNMPMLKALLSTASAPVVSSGVEFSMTFNGKYGKSSPSAMPIRISPRIRAARLAMPVIARNPSAQKKNPKGRIQSFSLA